MTINASPPKSLQNRCQGASQHSNQVLLEDAGVLEDAVAETVAVDVEDVAEAVASDLDFSVLGDSDLLALSICFSSVFFAAPAVLLPPRKSVTYQPPPFN